MANYYTHTSLMLQELSSEEKKWFEKVLAFSPENVDEPFEEVLTLLELKELNSSMLDLFPDVEYSWLPTGDLVLHHGESIDLEHLADILQGFLRKFRPKQAISVTYAETCDRPRPDSFTGGLIFITAEHVEWWGAAAEAERCMSAFTEEGEGLGDSAEKHAATDFHGNDDVTWK